MPRLFFGNFDFEHGLANRNAMETPALLQRLNGTLAGLWSAVADAGDFIWLPTEVEAGFYQQLAQAGLPDLKPMQHARDLPTGIELWPWGAAADLPEWAIARNWKYHAPDWNVVQQVNRRSFRLKLENELGCQLTGSALVTSQTELQAAINTISQTWERWVLKAEFGMSSRERMLGTGPMANAVICNWANKRLNEQGCLVIEPWVTAIDEAGLQFTVPQQGTPTLDGITPMAHNRAGHYGGNRFFRTDDLQQQPLQQRWQQAVDCGLEVAGRLQQADYFGPLGIDAMYYLDPDGQQCLRSLQDLNARQTMGRMGLGFRRLLKPGEQGSLLHLAWSRLAQDSMGKQQSIEDWYNSKQAAIPAAARVIRLTPFEVEGQAAPVGMVLVIAPSGQLMTEVETILSTAK